MNNIDNLNSSHFCTSCQMCAAVCPKNAISIHLDKEGFYRPSINEALCVDCGLCLKVCYKFDHEIKRTSSSELENMPLYAVYAKDRGLLQSVTSGGVADLLAKQLIKDGFLCVGVDYDNEKDIAFHSTASSIRETDAFRGSKYIQSYSFSAFKELVNGCMNHRYAVFGTPCQIYAVDKYLNLRKIRDQFILIDLYCHGCPSLYVWQKYMKEIKALMPNTKFDAVTFRDKIKGWGNYVVVAAEKDVKVFVSSPKKDEFYELFFSDQILNEACSDCKLRSTMAYTDIRLGDFWGKRYAMNTEGVSAVSLVTERGKSLFDSILDIVIYKKHSYDDFMPYQSYGKNYHPNSVLRRKLFDILSDENSSLRPAIEILHGHQSVKQKIKRYIKHLFYYLPPIVIALIKRLR